LHIFLSMLQFCSLSICGVSYVAGDYTWGQSVSQYVNMLYLVYRDAKPVRFLSTIHGPHVAAQDTTAKRWDKKNKVHIEVKVPVEKKNYDNEMGGIDGIDMLESMCRVAYRLRRPHLVNFIWCLEMAVIVAHRFNKMLYAAEYAKTKRTLADDQVALARGLILQFSDKDSSVLFGTEDTSKKNSRKTLPLAKDHFLITKPRIVQKPKCCAPGCHKRPTKVCARCNVFLCSPNDTEEGKTPCWVVWHSRNNAGYEEFWDGP
jgi:hypothetical protein